MNTKLLPLLSLAAIYPLAAQPLGKANSKQPNILFCIADDAGHMSAYGTRWVNTPAFDRVAKQGILFNNMYTCNAKSAPSRAAIITGRNSWQLEEACNHWPYFPAKFKSYPEVLTENGYTVGYTGKGWSPGYANDAQGKKRELTGRLWNKRKLTPPTNSISACDYAANFNDFMAARDKSKPFCFWYGALEPHRGYEFESSIRFGKQLSDIDSVPSYWPDNDIVRRDMLDYAVEVEHFDRQLGLILQALEEAGELDNTLIIVTSDHNMPFPRHKGQTYYSSNHIPLAVMWGKELANPGRKVDEYISVIDLAPTILEATGLAETTTGMQPITGRSFMDLLKDERTGIDRNYVMLGKERHDVGRPDDQGYPVRALIRGDFLYMKNFEPTRWPAGNPETGYMDVDGSPTKTEVLKARRNPKTVQFWQYSFGKRKAEELYNIRRDPNCLVNLIADSSYQTIRTNLEKEMTARLLEQGDPRMYNKGYIFDSYPDASGARLFWNRMKNGENPSAGWINRSDMEEEEPTTKR